MPHPSDRPTVPPAFDVEKYAKESDQRIAVPKAAEPDPQPWAAPESPQSEVRLVTHPAMGAVVSDEAWAAMMGGAPVVVMPLDLLKRLPLDHRAGFLLSLMDGQHALETMVEIAGMERAEVLRFVRDLFEAGVVDFRS
jgi:hypothetical protein